MQLPSDRTEIGDGLSRHASRRIIVQILVKSRRTPLCSGSLSGWHQWYYAYTGACCSSASCRAAETKIACRRSRTAGTTHYRTALQRLQCLLLCSQLLRLCSLCPLQILMRSDHLMVVAKWSLRTVKHPHPRAYPRL